MSTITTSAVTTKLENWFNDFGWPTTLRSDGGRQFTSGQFEEWCQENGIKHELSNAYFSQSNGHAESAVKQMKYLLLKTGGKFNTQFRNGLLAYRNMPRDGGSSPAQLLFGRRLRSNKLPIHPSQYEAINLEEASSKKNALAARDKLTHDQRSKHCRF